MGTETIYVLICSGDFTEDINGTPMTAPCVEPIVAFRSEKEATALLESGKVDVADPKGWGVRGISIYPVEVKSGD